MTVTARHDHHDNDPTGPYAAAAGHYWANGWRGILPLPPRAKKPVPRGWTGNDGATPSYADIHAWTEGPEGAGNLALRMPHHVIGIDVDDYASKNGGTTLTRLEQQWGTLPATWRSTSRDDKVSGIRLYQVPEGLAWPGDLGPGIEIIQHRHRYTVAWPSIHPDTGGTYRWINPHGQAVIGDVPAVDDLPNLPHEWVQGITHGELATDTPRLDLPDAAIRAWLDARAGTEGTPPCRAVTTALARYTTDLTDRTRARHDIALAATARLAHLASEGHPGVATALRAFKTAWTNAMGNERADDLPSEWARMLTGAVKIAAADPQHGTDPCDNPFHGLIPQPRQEPPCSPNSTTPVPTTSTAPTTPTTNASAAASSTTTTANGPAADVTDAGTSTPDPTDTTAADAAYELALQRHQLLQQEVERQRAQRAARRLLDDEEAATTFREPTWRTTLTDELAIPDEPVSYLVDQVFPTGANVLLTAQFKAGKTTLVNHLTRCLADQEPFLDTYDTHATGRIALWNYEVDERQYRRWLRDLDVTNTDRITVLNLRGYRMPLVTPRVEDWIVQWLQDHEITVWVVDPFARAFTGSGDSENDNTEVGRFLDTLDVIKHRAGVSELVMPVHTGRAHQDEGQERARGATRLDDWADVRWLLTKDDEDQRYFRATGRDVEVPEGRLEHHPATRSLALNAGESRRAKAAAPVVNAVLEAARLNPGLGLKALRDYCRNSLGTATNTTVDDAIRVLVHQGRLRVEKGGPGRASAHWIVDITELVTQPTTVQEPAKPDTLPNLAEPCHGKDQETLPPTRRGGKVGNVGSDPAEQHPARSTTANPPEPANGLEVWGHCKACGSEVPAYIVDIGQATCPHCKQAYR